MLLSNNRNKLLQETLTFVIASILEKCDLLEALWQWPCQTAIFHIYFSWQRNSNIFHGLAISCTVLFTVLCFKLHGAFIFFLLGMGISPPSLSPHSPIWQNTPIWDDSVAGARGDSIGTSSKYFDLFTH